MAEVARQEAISTLDGAATEDGNPLEEAAGLAIKGINLFQGDKGIELWRLKASWAHLHAGGRRHQRGEARGPVCSGRSFRRQSR